MPLLRHNNVAALRRNWSIMSASIANVTDGESPFQLNFYMRLQSAFPAYIALDSIHLAHCYQGDTWSFVARVPIALYCDDCFAAYASG